MKNNINLHLLNASGSFTSYKAEIEENFNKAINQITQKLPVTDVDVVISDSPRHVIPEIGIGGYAPNAHLIFISLDPKFPEFDKTITKELKRTLAHELHHTMRWRNPGYGTTLLEALVTEGLADHFDIEVFGEKPEPWCTALDKEQIKIYMKKAHKEFHNKRYAHGAWFFGSKEKGIPRWTGYTLGFALVGEYLQRNPDKKPSELYHINANEFVSSE